MNSEAATLTALLYRLRSYGWWSAKDISASTGWNLRKVRAVAASAKGTIISSPGGKGYKHRSACTEAEIQHAAASYKRQAKAMNQHAAAILRG